MNEVMTIKEVSLLWNLPETLIARYCREGRIRGAYKNGKSWSIPITAERPADLRRKNNIKGIKLPLPIGISDYRVASEKYYYVDKTLFIKDFLDEKPMVSLFTRPRRFGKTLTMDMVRTFFEKTGEDTSKYFVDKKIWKCGDYYRQYQGKYPVIFLSFKDVKSDTWEETYALLSNLLKMEFRRHRELKDSDKISSKDFYDKIINETATESDFMLSLLYLSQMLDEHYGVAPIIIIDEYDTPIQQGYMRGFYDKVVQFMRNLFSGGLKDNKHLSYGFLTGILRVAKESIFSGLNNLKINSILDNRYSQYFGFTVDEIKQMTKYYGVSNKFGEIVDWYDGYNFGRTEIFNPWSVINYFNNECVPRAFWLSTGNNEIIGEILENADESIYERLKLLLQGKTFATIIDTSVIYPQIKSNPMTIYSFLLVAGYLNVLRYDNSSSGDYICEVGLPNKEITYVYNKEVLNKLVNIVPQSVSATIQEAIYTNDAMSLKNSLRKLLLESASSFDVVGENFYHGLVLGLCAVLDEEYSVTSNRESGEGRYDIQLLPRNLEKPGVLIELKAGKNIDEENLKRLAQVALQQIKEKKYDTEMLSKGVKTIFKFGVAFSGKNVEVVVE